MIHADLFPDNVFFRDRDVSGLIDFYFACTDFFAYDLAVCLNAWCFEADGSLNVTKARLLLDDYRRARPLAPEELAALPLLARGSALRFLLTRLFDWLNQPQGALVRPKDPLEFLRKLRFHRTVGKSARLRSRCLRSAGPSRPRSRSLPTAPAAAIPVRAAGPRSCAIVRSKRS